MLGILIPCIIIEVNSISELTESQVLAQHCTRTIMSNIKAECLQSGKCDCMSLQQLWWGDNVIPKLTVYYFSMLCLVPVNVRHQHVFVVLIRQVSFFLEIHITYERILTCRKELSDLERLDGNLHN